MSRRRRQLRLMMVLCAGFVTLNYMAPMFIQDGADMSMPAPATGQLDEVTRLSVSAGQRRTTRRKRHTFVQYSTKSKRESIMHSTQKIILQNLENLTSNSIGNESDGYNLSKRVRDACRGTMPAFMRRWKSMRLHSLFRTEDERIQLCPVWKAGTTFLRRLFLMKINSTYSDLTNPYDISYAIRYYTKSHIIHNSDTTERFLFVRDPFDRIFSSYIDKLLAPNPYYWVTIGTRAVRLMRGAYSPKISLRCGHDLTFSEYIKYIIAALSYTTPGAQIDPHFLPIQQLCSPCVVDYNFIGKVETFKQDYPVLVRELNLTHADEILATLERDGDELASIDAIEDSTHQPFDPDFLPKLEDCMTRREVLNRAWKKMQIRGLIKPLVPLPLTQAQAVHITEKDFFELAKECRARSTPEERREYKHKQFFEFYSQVPKRDMVNLRKYYLNDLKLFEYDDRPRYLFPNN